MEPSKTDKSDIDMSTQPLPDRQRSHSLSTVVFPGSFNPFTVGHEEIVARALEIFDGVIIAVGFNINKPGADENAEIRAGLIGEYYRDEPRVSVCSYSTLTTELCRRTGAAAMIRGVRSCSDFDYEKTLADTNMAISGLPTLLMPCRPELSYISSSMVRELKANGHDISKYVIPTFLDQ